MASYNADVAGNVASYNAPAGGNVASYNAPAGGNVATYNSAQPAVAGAPASAMGVTLPGSNVGGTPAPYTPPQKVSYYDYPDSATYPVTVSDGGNVVIKSN